MYLKKKKKKTNPQSDFSTLPFLVLIYSRLPAVCDPHDKSFVRRSGPIRRPRGDVGSGSHAPAVMVSPGDGELARPPGPEGGQGDARRDSSAIRASRDESGPGAGQELRPSFSPGCRAERPSWRPRWQLPGLCPHPVQKKAAQPLSAVTKWTWVLGSVKPWQGSRRLPRAPCCRVSASSSGRGQGHPSDTSPSPGQQVGYGGALSHLFPTFSKTV